MFYTTHYSYLLAEMPHLSNSAGLFGKNYTTGFMQFQNKLHVKNYGRVQDLHPTKLLTAAQLQLN